MKGLTLSIFKRFQSDISSELTFMPRSLKRSEIVTVANFSTLRHMMESTKWQQVRKCDSISG